MNDSRSQMEPYLAPGERLLWTGRPAQGIAFQTMDLFAVPFSIVWASVVFGIFSKAPASGHAAPILLQLLFAAVAGYITVGRFVMDAWLLKRA